MITIMTNIRDLPADVIGVIAITFSVKTLGRLMSTSKIFSENATIRARLKKIYETFRMWPGSYPDCPNMVMQQYHYSCEIDATAIVKNIQMSYREFLVVSGEKYKFALKTKRERLLFLNGLQLSFLVSRGINDQNCKYCGKIHYELTPEEFSTFISTMRDIMFAKK
jgi:hypothetical protein